MDVSQAVTDMVAAALPSLQVAYGEFPGKAPCAMVKASPGDAWVRRYLSGGGVRRFSYEVYLRTLPRGSEGARFDALASLRSLQAAIESGAAPEGVPVRTHEVTSVPAQYAAQQDGCVVYQLQAAITYMA